MEAPRPGDRIGLFELVAPIGSGSAGTVFRAVHTQTKADVALKLVHESRAAFFKRVYLELDTLRSIRHENVVRVYAAGRHGPWAYLAMEFVPGVPVRTWVDAASPNERIDRILRVGAQMATGLAAVHDAGVVHRDLKPENAIVMQDGTVKLLDFGTARFLDGTDVDTHVAGTIRYMAPEQLAGAELDRRADLFSLGVLLFEMIAGRPPHRAADTAHLILAQCTERAAPIASLAPALPRSAALIIDHLLSTAPADRPRSAHEVVLHLTKALGEQMIPIEERAAVLTSRFVERKPLVTSLLKRSLSREGGVIVLQGPPGIGLSRLLQELRGDFVVRGGRPALVKGGPDVLLDVLDSIAGPLVAAETRDALLGEDRALLLDSFPELRRKGERGEEARPWQRVRLATTRVLRRATEDGRPLLVVVDDAEKAHPADLRCLVGHGVLVLASHMPERLEIVGDAMNIPPLSPGAMAEMARSIIGDGGAALAWDESELLAGNPKELARRAQQWALAEFPHQTSTEDPSTVAADWESAIDRLERDLVDEHPVEILARLQEELPDPTSAGDRWRMEALASWAHYLAGRDKESLVHATRAAELAPGDRGRIWARLLGARCALRRGHYGACLEEAAFSWHQAAALGDVDLAVQWSAHQVETLLKLGRINEAQLVLERASTHLPQARLEGRLALEWIGVRVAIILCAWNEALVRIAEVRNLVQSPPRPRIEAGMYIEEGRLELRRGQISRARALLVHASSVLEPLGDSVNELRAAATLAHLHLMEGNLAASRQCFERCLALAERTASRAGLAMALGAGLRLARFSGDTDLTIGLLDRVAQLPPNWADEPAAALVHSERALALLLLGDGDGAKAAHQAAQAIDVEDPHDNLLVRLHELLLRDALGEPVSPEQALEVALEAQTLGLGHIERMAKGLALRRGASVDVRAFVAEAKKAGDLLAAFWAGASLLPEVRADAKERGFQSFVARQ
jgi:hypothetical protein